MEPSKSMNQGSQAMKICSESSHSDGEFSLFPSRKHHRQKGKSRGTLDSTLANNFSHSKGTQKKSVQSHFLDSEASSAQGVASGVGKGLSVSTVSNAFDELFDMSDITFSTARVSAHSSNIADKDKSTKPDSQSGVRVEKVYAFSKSAGLSWLFSDSEDESDDENGERVEAQKASFSSTSEKKQVATSSTFSKKRVQILNPHDQSRLKGKAGSSKSARIKRTFSSEQSFLAGSDILHTHINTGVLGASRAEDHMTRCAIKDVYELNMNTQAPALVCDPLSQPDDEEYGSEKQTKEKGKRKKTLSSQESKEENYDKRQSIKAGTYKLLIGQTPTSIARRQFSELARSKDMSELDFARYVVETSLGCRLDMLKEFYIQKHSKIELVEAVTKLYSITSKSGTAKPEIGIFPSGVDKIRKISDAESSKTTHQTPYKYQTTGTCASSNGERQRKSPGRSSPINPREQPCSSRAPTPFFLEPCTYASDSQESITAKSPKLCHVDASTDSQGYQPVSPPPKRRLSPHIKKVSPVKSKHRTRLRHLQNKDKKEETVTFQHEYQEISTYLPQDKFSNQPDIGMVMQNIQPSEDISSVLHEMGHDGSLSVEEKSVNSSKNIISNSGRSRLPKVQVSHDVIASKTRKGSSMMHIKSSSDKARATSTRRRQAVSVLDDIFGDNPPSSLKEDQVCEGPDSKFDDIPHGTKKCDRRKNKEPSAEAKQSISKIELHGTSTKSNNWTESEIKPAKGNMTPAKIINNRSKDTPGTSTTGAADAFMDDYNESEILNAIITSSTFHEEAQPTCLHKSSVTRRNREEKKRLQTTMKCVRDKKLLEEEQNAGADFDDLENWDKFNLNHPAPIESESLFS